MKKFLSVWFVTVVLTAAVVAAPVLVYKSEADVRAGKSVLGIQTQDGVLVPASQVMGQVNELILGFFSGDLNKGQFLRLDTELDVALLRTGDPISAADLKKAHQKKVDGIRGFLPSQIELRSDDVLAASGKTPVEISTIPFQLKINGLEVDNDPVVLKKSRREAEAKLEFVKLSTITAWNLEVTIEADPPHLFWKKGETQTLTRVPQKSFSTSQRLIFSPLRPGDIFKVSLELSGIKSDETEWSISVRTKQESWKKKMRIRFE